MGAGAGPAGVGTARGVRDHATPVGCQAVLCHRGKLQQQHAQGLPMRWLQGVGQAVICSPWCGVLAGPGAGPLAGDGRGACLGAGAGPAGVGTARGQQCQSAARRSCATLGPLRQASATSCHTGQGRHMRWLQGVGQAVICSPWCGVLAGPGAGPLAGDGRGACLGAGAGPAGVGTARGQRCQSAARRSCATVWPQGKLQRHRATQAKAVT